MFPTAVEWSADIAVMHNLLLAWLVRLVSLHFTPNTHSKIVLSLLYQKYILHLYECNCFVACFDEGKKGGRIRL